MDTKKETLSVEVNKFCQTLEQEFSLIPEERKEKLISLGGYISSKIKANKTPKLIVICTHNSRRSHIGQLWLAIGADYYGLSKIETFSGGTEATAFNIRAVNAFQRIGFEISTQNETDENPIYEINWKYKMQPYNAFSKKYEDEPNPRENFAAIMVCSSADQDCPIVFGCDFRLSLPYDDPKNFDDTDLEQEKYDERVKQIGREILFSLNQIKNND
ncbi:MAG: hypothetical protein ACPG5B_16810 [Chitinophagales bacterium]